MHDGYPRLATSDPRGIARQCRSCGPFLPPRVQPASDRRSVRPDRDQHDWPRRHAKHWPRWICNHGGTIYRCHPPQEVAGPSGRGRQRRSCSQGALSGPYRLDGRDQCRSSPRTCSMPAATRPEALKANADKSFHRQLRPRHGLHLRRHRQKGRGHPDRGDAPIDRKEHSAMPSGSFRTSAARRSTIVPPMPTIATSSTSAR